MKILLINHYAGSDRMGMEYRPFYFAREWIAANHDVTIIAADFSHLRGTQPVVRGDLATTEEEGVRFRWLRTNSYTGNGAGRAANMLAFVGKLFANVGRIAQEERPDLVICSSTYPLDIYPGARIARKLGARLVFEVHDLWPLTPILLGGYSQRHPYIRLLQHAEDWAYHHADTVVSLLPNAKDYMVEHGLDPSRFVHIPNGIVTSWPEGENAALPVEVQRLIDDKRSRNRFLIGFAGGINLNMALDTLLDAARCLATEEIAFVVAGDGSNAAALRQSVTQTGVDNFHMVGRLAKRVVPTFLSCMDALVVPWHRNPLYRYGISPNKLFDYMLAAKPILHGSDASNDPVAEADCGITVEPENAAALADGARRLLALGAEGRRRIGGNGRRYVMQHHDCNVLARQFLEAVTSSALRTTSDWSRTAGQPAHVGDG
jgi:glycosyltransferase involved in cell wall biosynthesis